MKILIASDLHYPTLNGVATFSRNLAKGMAARGHEVVVIAPSQTGKRYKEIDGNHVIYRTVSVAFPFYQNFRISLNPYREVKKIIGEFDPDVIHIQMLMGIGQAVQRYGNKVGIPIVSTNHAIPENLMDNLKMLAPVSRPINFMLKNYGARFHARSDYVTAPTQSAIDMFGQFNDRIKCPMEAVSNGIDLSRFKPTKPNHEIYKKFGIPTTHPVVSYIGRIDSEKHVWVLVDAFAKIQKATGAHLLIVGGGTEERELKLQALEHGIDKHVTFTGRVSDEDLVELHKVGTVYVMPSPAELQSIATLEAMASGKPIIAVDAGALGELCQHEVNGFLCPKDDVDCIAKHLSEILLDSKLQEAMSKKSLEIAKTHDINTTLERFENIYKSLL